MSVGETFDSVLSAAQAGADWAFEVLYDELNPSLLRYFQARTPRDAEDLASETWLGAARKLKDFGGDEQTFRSWLFTIAHRRMVDHWSEIQRRAWDPVDPASIDDPPAADDPEEIVIEAASAQAAARRIVSLLTADQAEVVLLRLLGGLDVDQVAAVMGKRAGTVRVLQHRALRKLAREISLEVVTP